MCKKAIPRISSTSTAKPLDGSFCSIPTRQGKSTAKVEICTSSVRIHELILMHFIHQSIRCGWHTDHSWQETSIELQDHWSAQRCTKESEISKQYQIELSSLIMPVTGSTDNTLSGYSAPQRVFLSREHCKFGFFFLRVLLCFLFRYLHWWTKCYGEQAC